MTKKWFLSLAMLMTAAVYAEIDITGSTDSATRIISDALSPEDIARIGENPEDSVYVPCAVRECLEEIDCSAFEGGSPLSTLVSNCNRGMSVLPGGMTKSAINKAITYYESTPGSESANYIDALTAYKKELEAGQATFSVKAPAPDSPDVRSKEKSVCPPPALKKDVVTGSALFIKGKGAVCGDFKVGCNLSVGGGVSFNHRGCTKLRAKGALEKNLLNVRGVFAFDCNPCLSLSLENNCNQTAPATLDAGPRVLCIDQYLKACLGNPAVKLRCGFGIAPECATVKASGTACASYAFTAPSADPGSASVDTLITTVTVEVSIPLCFCVPFCDCPAIVASYEDRSVCPRSICVGSPTEIPFPGGCGNANLGGSSESLTTFLGTSVSLQHSSRTNVWLKIAFTYQNCAKTCGFVIDNGGGAAIILNRAALCTLQQNAIQTIGTDANQRLQSLWTHVIAEGRVL